MKERWSYQGHLCQVQSPPWLKASQKRMFFCWSSTRHTRQRVRKKLLYGSTNNHRPPWCQHWEKTTKEETKDPTSAREPWCELSVVSVFSFHPDLDEEPLQKQKNGTILLWSTICTNTVESNIREAFEHCFKQTNEKQTYKMQCLAMTSLQSPESEIQI